MAQLLIRKLDQSVKDALKAQAALHKRSMEEEVRLILERELSMSAPNREEGLGTRIVEAMAKGPRLSQKEYDAFEKSLEELRREPWPDPIDFER